MTKQGKSFLKLIAFLSLFLVCIAVVYSSIYGIEEEAFRVLIRESAKIAAILFAVSFGISSMHYFTKANVFKKALFYRPHIGLAFVVFHTFHLCSLVYLQMNIHPVFELAKKSSLFAGSMAYLFMYLMAFTTFPSIKQRVSTKSWKVLHLIGGYWIWFIFFNSYFKNVINKQQYYFLFGLFVFVLLIRIAKVIHRRVTA
jgi:DMSO/TMAO reductase YedYZ heme-binding membrane subunit